MSNTKINLTPVSGYLIIEPVEATKKTLSGIYLPETSDEKPQMGVVLVVGADELTDKGVKRTSPAKKGETVVYKKWGANEIKHNGKDYLLAKFDDILAIVEN